MLEIEILLYTCVTDLNFVRLRNFYFPHQTLQRRQHCPSKNIIYIRHEHLLWMSPPARVHWTLLYHLNFILFHFHCNIISFVYRTTVNAWSVKCVKYSNKWHYVPLSGVCRDAASELKSNTLFTSNLSCMFTMSIPQQYLTTYFLKIANSNHTIQFCVVTVNTNSKEIPYSSVIMEKVQEHYSNNFLYIEIIAYSKLKSAFRKHKLLR